MLPHPQRCERSKSLKAEDRNKRIKGEMNMIRLTRIFDLLGNEELITIYEGQTKLYFGECGKCTLNIFNHAYVKEMKFDNRKGRYIVKIRYM